MTFSLQNKHGWDAAVLTAAHCVVDTGNGRITSIEVIDGAYGYFQLEYIIVARAEAEHVRHLPAFYCNGVINWDYDVALIHISDSSRSFPVADKLAWPQIRRTHLITHSLILDLVAVHVTCAMAHNTHVKGWIPLWHAILQGY